MDVQQLPLKESVNTTTTQVAIIFGVTGLVGKELAKKLTSTKTWKVYGVARQPETNNQIQKTANNYYHFISCDLLNPFETQQKLSTLHDLTHVFWVTWATQFPLDTKECCDENKFMLSNALDAIIPIAKALKHVSLQTGMKHYISFQVPNNEKGIQYYNEVCPRTSDEYNFYYVLEDLLKERLEKHNVVWSVHRPGILMGSSNRTLYNFIGSLCVYGTICKFLNLPFVFGGTKECWEEVYMDGSDSRLVADQHIWASSKDEGHVLNAINGDSFTWKEIWPQIGKKFGVDVLYSEGFLYSTAMADKTDVWNEIVKKKGLVETAIEDLANWGFLDILFRFPFKLLGTRDKANQLGFTTQYQTLDSILYWIDVMRDEKLISY